MLTDDDKNWITDAVVTAIGAAVSGLRQEISSSAASLNTLMTDLHQSTQREIHELRTDFTERFDAIDARLKLQAGLIQSGARALARFSEYSENSESRWLDLSRSVRTIEQKLQMNGVPPEAGYTPPA